MRITLLHTILIGLTLSLGYAHDAHTQGLLDRAVSIKANRMELRKVLSKIEGEVDVKFVYSSTVIQPDRRVSVKAEQRKLSEVLAMVLEPLDISYRVIGGQIMLTRTRAKESSFIPDVEVKLIADQVVTGTVTDEGGGALPGVSVLVKGTQKGTVTNQQGAYTLSVPDGDALLVFSFVGYVAQEVAVGNRTKIDLALAVDDKLLDEVVVVGYGTQKKVNLTGAVSTVEAESIQNRPITSASQALQGTQGVYLNQVGGQPGKDGATIRVRGIGTLNNNNPLVLVNGIEFALDDLNPNDIESITVLKDAASAAIYGSRAANGVILVTTKKGSSNSSISYGNSFGLQEVMSLPRVVRDPIQWFELYSQAQRNVGTSENSLVFSKALIEEYRNGMQSDPFTYPNTDWYDVIFDPASIQEHNLRFSGGNEESTYALSLGFLDQDGVMRGTNAKRYNANLNINSALRKNLSIGGTFNFSYKQREEPVPGIGTTMQMIFKAQSHHPTYLEDGNYGMNFFDIPGHRRFRHPLAYTDEGENKINNLKLFLNTYAEVGLPLGIKYKVNIGLTSENERSKRFIPEIVLYDAKTKQPTKIQAGGSSIVEFGDQRGVNQRDDESLNFTIFNTLKWDRQLTEKTNLNFLLGQSYEKFNNTFFTANNEGYLGNGLFELNAGTTNPRVGGTSRESSLISYFGRANLVLLDKYLFEANFRYDGSSKFAKGNQWGFFPSASAGWRLDEEAFLKNVNWLDQLKVRASWGKLGNERIGLYRFLDLIAPGQDYLFGNTLNPGTAVLVDNDDKISWETTTITNIGADASFFRGKLTSSFEFFNKTTDDVLRPVGIPSQVGALAGPIRNIGTVENKGVELSLGHRNTVGDFSYELSGNLTYITNKVVNLNGEIIIDDFSSDRRGPLNITQEGRPINQFLLYQSDGYFQSQREIDAHAFQGNDTKPGYIRFKDLDNNGVIDLNDRMAEGSTIPKYTYSFNTNITYKNISLSTIWQGVEGVQTYNKHVSGVPFWFGTSLPIGWANDSWTPENPNASLPLLTRYQDTQATLFRDSNFWLMDASYLRMKNIQLTYNFNPNLLKRIRVSKLAVFANAQNLLTFTALKDFDPETELLGGDFFNYPSVKIYTMGLNVSF